MDAVPSTSVLTASERKINLKLVRHKQLGYSINSLDLVTPLKQWPPHKLSGGHLRVQLCGLIKSTLLEGQTAPSWCWCCVPSLLSEKRRERGRSCLCC